MQAIKPVFFLVFVSLPFVLGACTAGETAPAAPAAPAAASMPTDAEKASPASAGSTCGAGANTGPLHEELVVDGVRPAFQGGEILDGVYERTASLVFTGLDAEAPASSGRHLRQTIILAGGHAEVAYSDDTGIDDRETFTVLAVGNEIEFRRTCPTAQSVSGRVLYTATPYELRIASGDRGINVYARRERSGT